MKAESPLSDLQLKILGHIDIGFKPDMDALRESKIRVCRLPNGTRFRAGNRKGVVKAGVTGPLEGVMVKFDDRDHRSEINPHMRVTPLWEDE